MGSVGINTARMSAFQNDNIPRGLDLRRSVIMQDLGTFKAGVAATFEAGMLVAQDVDGTIIKCVSKPVLGVAKWNKTNTLSAASVDEAVSFAIAGASATLRHPVVSNFQIRSAINLGGSPYASPGDYSLTALNGVIVHNAGGTIPVATTVYATYTFQLQTTDLDFQGRNFWNFTDEVSVQDGRITVITDASILFTSQYDTSRVYTMTGVGKNLYCGGNTPAKAGIFTNDNTEGEFVGHVIQIPSADDPFLGVRLGGDPVVQ